MCHGRTENEKWDRSKEKRKTQLKVKRKQRGIPIRKTDEGMAEDDSDV